MSQHPSLLYIGLPGLVRDVCSPATPLLHGISWRCQCEPQFKELEGVTKKNEEDKGGGRSRRNERTHLYDTLIVFFFFLSPAFGVSWARDWTLDTAGMTLDP